MTSKKKAFSPFACIVILWLVHGCVSSNQSISPPTVTEDAARNTLIPTLTTTLAHTVSHTKTPTEMPTITFTAVPTLSTDEAYVYMQAFLRNGPDCRLPCWWGITPGQSTMLDVQRQLAAFSGAAEYTYLGKSRGWLVGNLGIFYPHDEDIMVEIFSTYLAPQDNDVVLAISVTTQAYLKTNGSLEKLYGNPIYNKILEDFNLFQILHKYGQPSQMFITAHVKYVGLDNDPLPTDTFVIRLLYPAEGIFARYHMPVKRVGDKFRFCPFQAFVDLDLISSNPSGHYQDSLLAIGGWEGFFPPSEYNKTPEEALGMTIEEFYQQFHLPTKRCLETPVSIWPGR